MWSWLHDAGIEFDHFGGGTGDETVLNIVTTQGERQTANPGDWVLREVPGGFFIVRDADFRGEFEEEK
jgi:hypothetical protein